MTVEEAEQILGPELSAKIRARAAQAPPLTPEQIRALVPLLSDPESDTQAA